MQKRKIGEKFTYNSVVLEVKKETTECEGCYFKELRCWDGDIHEQLGDCESGFIFVEIKNHKQPKIDKMPIDLAQESDTFNSQREIWSYLSESEENKVVDDCGFVWSFYNGLVCCKNVSAKPTFSNYEVYKKYTPPKTITVNGVEIEAPLRSLEGVDVVYVPCFHWEDKYFKDGANDEAGQTAFKNNMAFATPEAAIACHDAIKKGIIIPQ